MTPYAENGHEFSRISSRTRQPICKYCLMPVESYINSGQPCSMNEEQKMAIVKLTKYDHNLSNHFALKESRINSDNPGEWNGQKISLMNTPHIRNAILWCETKHRESLAHDSVLKRSTIDEMFPQFQYLVNEGKRRGIIEIPESETRIYYVSFTVKTGQFETSPDMVFRQMFEAFRRKFKKATGLAVFRNVIVTVSGKDGIEETLLQEDRVE